MGFEGYYRAQANKAAKSEAERLHRALRNCREALDVALANVYVGVHLNAQYAQALIDKHGDEEIGYGTAERLASFLSELDTLAQAARRITDLDSLNVESLPTFSVGRDKSRGKLEPLVAELYRIASRRLPDALERRVEIGQGRLEIVQELLALVIDTPPEIKTLQNILSELRSRK